MSADYEASRRQAMADVETVRRGIADLKTRLAAATAREAALRAALAEAREALEFYGDKEAWTQPPIKTVAHELFGFAYENQASKMQIDRGTRARATLARIDALTAAAEGGSSDE